MQETRPIAAVRAGLTANAAASRSADRRAAARCRRRFLATAITMRIMHIMSHFCCDGCGTAYAAVAPLFTVSLCPFCRVAPADFAFFSSSRRAFTKPGYWSSRSNRRSSDWAYAFRRIASDSALRCAREAAKNRPSAASAALLARHSTSASLSLTALVSSRARSISVLARASTART